MGCLGRHLAITPAQFEELLRLAEADTEDGDIWEAIQVIEEDLPARYYQDSDKAWDSIHRALSLDNTPDGILAYEAGEFPLDSVVLTEEQLGQGEDYIMSYQEPDHVALLASALAEVDVLWLRKRFFQLDPAHTQYPIDEGEFDYLWGWFQYLPPFYARAAAEGRVVLFTVAL
jgi:hypothetical protein